MDATMHRTSRIKITDLNPHLVCILCGGYYVDATTIVECLHSFCRTCIVRYLDGSKYCPICDVQVHKTRPLLHIRRDKTLQALVYKLVPNLFKNEMERRRQFYAEHPEAGPSSSRASGEERGVIIPGLSPDKKALVDEEHISLSLEYSDNGKPVDEIDPSTLEPDNKLPEKRYLLCPSGFTVGHLKKFIKTKFELSSTHLVQVFHTDEPLVDHYTLMDVAYIYTWRRKGPLRLYFTIYLKKESSRIEGKKRKISESSDKTEENDSASECKRTAPSSPPSLRMNGTMNGTNGNAVDDGNNTTSSSEEIVSKPMTATISSVTSSVNVSKTTATPSAMSTTITLSSKPVKSETPPWLVAAMANAQRQAQTNAQTRVENMRKPPQEVSSANRTNTSQRTNKLTKSPKSTLEKALLAPSSKVFVSKHLQNNVCKSNQVSRAPTSVHKTPTPVLSRVLAPAGNRPGGRVLPPADVMAQRLMAPKFDVPQRSLTSSPEPVNTTSFLSKIATTPRAQTHNPVSPLDKITQTLQMAKMKSLNSNKIAASKPMTSTGTTKPMPSTGTTKPMPSTGTTKPMPSTATNKPMPSPGTTKPMSSTGSTKPMPSTGTTKPMPSTGATKPIPSTGSTKPISSVGTTTTVYSTLKSGAINSRAGPSKSQDAGCQMNSIKPFGLTVLTQPRSQPKSATLAKTIQKLTASQQPPPGKFQSTMAAMNNTLVSLSIPTSPLKTSAMTTTTSSITSPALVRPPPVSPLLNSSHSSIISVPRSLPATNAAMAALKPTGANIFKIMSQMSTSKSVMTPKPLSTSISTVTSKPGVTLTSVTNVKPATSKPIMTSSVIATSSSQISKTTVALAKSTSLSIVTSSGGSIKTTPLQQVGSSTPSAKVAVTSSVAQKCASPKPSNAIPVSNLPPPPSPTLVPSPSASPPVPVKTPPTPPKTKSPIAAPPSPVYSDPPQEKSLDLSKKRTKSDTNSNSEICLNGDHVNGETSTNGDSCKRLKTEETR